MTKKTKERARKLSTDQQAHSHTADSNIMEPQAITRQITLTEKENRIYATDGVDTMELPPDAFDYILKFIGACYNLREEGKFKTIEEYCSYLDSQTCSPTCQQ